MFSDIQIGTVQFVLHILLIPRSEKLRLFAWLEMTLVEEENQLSGLQE
jgi:hypothetical protein